MGKHGVKKFKIQPENQLDFYQEVQASYDGKNIVLRSNSSIDIYNLNWDKVHSFPLPEYFTSFKTFTDKINNFIVIFSRTGA